MTLTVNGPDKAEPIVRRVGSFGMTFTLGCLEFIVMPIAAAKEQAAPGNDEAASLETP